MTAAPDAMVVSTTTASLEAAEALAGRLLEARLAACVQITPVTSLYAWDGEITRQSEALLTIKTRASLFAALEAAIRDGHAYAVPEILAVPATCVSADYLAWLTDATG